MLTFHKTYQILEKRSHRGTREGLQIYVFLTSVYSLLHRQVKLYTFWKDDLNCLINSSLNTPEVQLPSSGDYNKTDINLEQCSIYSRLHIFILDFSPCFDGKSCNVTGLERDIGSQVALWADIACWVTVGQCHPSAVDTMEASLPKQTVNPAMRISFLGQFVQFDQNAAGGYILLERKAGPEAVSSIWILQEFLWPSVGWRLFQRLFISGKMFCKETQYI